MIDFRPVGHVIGLLITILGATMAMPLALDLFQGSGNWRAFMESAMISLLVGGTMAISCESHARDQRLTLQEIFLITTAVWLVLPIFGALPMILGAPGLSFTDGFFEAMSGMTTTGSTVISGLDDLPRGTLLWRGMLQWFGGIGIIVVAMVFLPELGVGGMQIFKSEGFETEGKILPRARQIASRISVIYVGLTLACGLLYAALGMSALDGLVHAMTTLSTGGFASYDSSFAAFSGAIHYVAVAFMLMSALPYVRYVQLVAGDHRPIVSDHQIKAFLTTVAAVSAALTLWLWVRDGVAESSFREALFNSASIVTGTGYASADYGAWGSFPIMLIFFAGLIGGCAGSTSCSVKIFRYQLLFSALRAQIRRIHSPNALFISRYDGRPVGDAILSSVMVFFVTFLLSLGLLAIALAMTGLDFITSVSGAATAIANVGPGLGPRIGPAGNFAGLSDTAKWLLAAGMLAGRLELFAVLVLLVPQFWRD